MDNKFDQLNMIDVTKYTKKKGNFSYLSWAYAVKELLKVAPDATWEIHEYQHSRGEITAPYMRTGAGCFVKVTVTVGGIDRTQIHPVLDHRNKTVDDPNAFQINTSIQRCLAKAIALHGLGLYIFAGEDLPREPDPLTSDQYREITNLLASMPADLDSFNGTDIMAKIDSKEINETNFKASLAKLNRVKEFNKAKNSNKQVVENVDHIIDRERLEDVDLDENGKEIILGHDEWHKKEKERKTNNE